MVKSNDDIISAVDNHHRATASLRTRFEDDYKLYRLERTPNDAPNDDYAFYTSSDPKAYAKKILGWQNSAKMVLQISKHDDRRHMRMVDDMKEEWLLKAFRMNDDRLLRLGQPLLRNQMGWYSSMRGWDFGRALLLKRKDGSTYVDITAFDPLNTYWGMGAEGLAWVCYKIKKQVATVEAQYGVSLGKTDEEAYDEVTVYDYYDEEINKVFTDEKTLKSATPHGDEGFVPVYMSVFGNAPQILSGELTDSIKDYGESIYEEGRGVIAKLNEIASILLHLARRTRRPGLKIFSADGRMTLEEDPHEEGTWMPLRRDSEDIVPLDPIQAAREIGPLLQVISGEWQRATLPTAVYGDLQFQLSGYAINTLKQGMETALGPRLQMMENTYRQICQMLSRQYGSGSFMPLEDLEHIAPVVLSEGCEPHIKLVAQLPEDDPAKMAAAQMAREGPVPLFPDYYIRNEIMGVQDADTIEDAIKTQMAERGLPEAALYTLYQAALRQGRQDIAQFYLDQLMISYMQKMSMLKMGGMGQGMNGGPPGGGPPGGGPPGGAGPTMPPSAMPDMMINPTPAGGGAALSNPGPQVPPGTARPGALGPQEQLRRTGLGP